MEKTKYNLQHYIDKFSKIDDKNWTTGTFHEKVAGVDKYCALGHCMDGVKQNTRHPERLALEALVHSVEPSHTGESTVIHVNDSQSWQIGEQVFNQKTPKERVLALLCRLKTKEEIKNLK